MNDGTLGLYLLMTLMTKSMGAEICCKMRSHKIVGIQNKLVLKIMSHDLKLFLCNYCGLGVLMGSFVFICRYSLLVEFHNVLVICGYSTFW